MTVIQFAQILALVGGAIDLAARVVIALREAGCSVEGCPVEVERLMPADIPLEGDAMRAARNRAIRHASGLERDSDRVFRGPIDMIRREALSAVDPKRDARDYAAEMGDPGDEDTDDGDGPGSAA